MFLPVVVITHTHASHSGPIVCLFQQTMHEAFYQPMVAVFSNKIAQIIIGGVKINASATNEEHALRSWPSVNANRNKTIGLLETRQFLASLNAFTCWHNAELSFY